MNKAWLWSFAKRTYVLAVVALLAWAVYDARAAFGDWREWLWTPGSGLFVLGWICMAAMLGVAWAWALREYLGIRLPVREWLPIQATAWAGRYLPGKLGLLAGKLALLEKPGVDWRGLGFSVLFEQLAFVAIGAVIVVALPWPRPLLEGWREAMPPTFVTAVSLSAAALIVAGFLVAMGIVAKRSRLIARPPLHTRVRILAGYATAHVVAGLGFFAAVIDQWPLEATVGPMDAVALLALANLAGIVAIFAPAGIGVREAVIGTGLAAHGIPWSEAVAFAAVLRVLTVGADIVFCALAGGLGRWVRTTGI